MEQEPKDDTVMKYRPGGIYKKKETDERYIVPVTNKWVEDEPPELVVLQREDDLSKVIGIRKDSFLAEYEDTGETHKPKGGTTFV